MNGLKYGWTGVSPLATITSWILLLTTAAAFIGLLFVFPIIIPMVVAMLIVRAVVGT